MWGKGGGTNSSDYREKTEIEILLREKRENSKREREKRKKKKESTHNNECPLLVYLKCI